MSSGESGHHAAGPSRPGSVVLDIGPGTGALVLLTPPDLEGAEIDISGADDPGADRVRYAAVYPCLPAGTYTIWRDAGTPAGAATIADGAVTEWH